MPDNDPNLMTIFAEALERTDPAERAAYLDDACGEIPPSVNGSRRCSPPTTGPAGSWKPAQARPNRPDRRPGGPRTSDPERASRRDR